MTATKPLTIIKISFHSIIPSLILFLMPRSLKTILLASLYVIMTTFIYHARLAREHNNIYAIAFIANLINTILIVGYTESDDPLNW